MSLYHYFNFKTSQFITKLAIASTIACINAPVILGQTVVKQGVIERPIVQNVNINTTVQAPARVLLPQMPPFNDTKAYIISQNEYEKQIRGFRYKYLGNKKRESLRNQGFMELSKFNQPAAIVPLIKVLRKEKQDVQDWLFKHLNTAFDPDISQSVMTWISIYDENPQFREKAMVSLKDKKANFESQWLIDYALRLPDDNLVTAGAIAAGQFNLAEAIPLLITSQGGNYSTRGGTGARGDLAWIFVGNQRYYVSDLTPVVGDSAVAFDPTVNAINEGSLMVIEDALVEFRRFEVHDVLLNLIERDYGQRIDFGFDTGKWQNWYRNEYIPFKKDQEKQEREKLRNQPATPQPQGSIKTPTPVTDPVPDDTHKKNKSDG